MLEKLGLVANSKPQENAIKQMLGVIVGMDKIGGVMQKCNVLKGADKCDTGMKLYSCYYENKAMPF